MQEYDIALKALLRASAASVVRQVSGESMSEWLDTETPAVKTSRVVLPPKGICCMCNCNPATIPPWGF